MVEMPSPFKTYRVANPKEALVVDDALADAEGNDGWLRNNPSSRGWNHGSRGDRDLLILRLLGLAWHVVVGFLGRIQALRAAVGDVPKAYISV